MVTCIPLSALTEEALKSLQTNLIKWKNGGHSLSNVKMAGAKVMKRRSYWLSEGQAIRKARIYESDVVRQRYFKEVMLDIILLFCNLHSIFFNGCSQSARKLFLLWPDMWDWWVSCFYRRLIAGFFLSKAHKTGFGFGCVSLNVNLYITFL